jgi:GxxExxY protein
MTKRDVDKISYRIIGAAIAVHRELGPGLTEAMYHKSMLKELALRDIKFVTEHPVEVDYKGEKLLSDMRCDILVEDTVVVELKAACDLLPIFEAQLLTYMKLLKKPKGVLINFNCRNIFKFGQRTMVNEFYRKLAA